MRFMTLFLTLPFLLLACSEDEKAKDDDVAECVDDTATDTGVDTGETIDTGDTATDPVDTGSDTGDTATDPADTGTDTGAGADTGTGTDTGTEDTGGDTAGTPPA
jgi:hypothetical protein